MKDGVNKTPRENFKTFPIAEIDKVNEVDQVTIPSKESVKNAKDWVDFNEK